MPDTATRALRQKTEGRLWLTDAGLETAMIYLEWLDLPQFAPFTLLQGELGRDCLKRYFDSFIAVAAHTQTGFVLDTVTWRSSDGCCGTDVCHVSAIAHACMPHLYLH